jgi:hypothetical protein
VLRIKLLNNTEIYGQTAATLSQRTAQVVLSANYSRKGITWYAVKIRIIGMEKGEEDLKVDFQECQLEQKLIKI